MLKNLKIGGRLALGFGVVLALALVNTGAGYWGVRTVADQLHSATRQASIVEHSQEARAHTLGLRRFEKDLFLNLGSREKEDEYLGKWESQQQQLLEHLETLDTLVDEDSRATVGSMRKDLDLYMAGLRNVLSQIRSGQIQTPSEANTAMGPVKDDIRRLESTADAFAADHSKAMKADVEAVPAKVRTALAVLVAVTLLTLAAAALVTVLIARSISLPIGRCVSLLERIAAGDLTGNVETSARQDEIGSLLSSVARMTETLRRTIHEIQAGSSTVAGATSQINASSRRTAETSQSQLSAVQETTTSAAELQETARVAGERAREIQAALARTVESGQSIKVQLAETTDLLGRAREELQTIVGSVQGLSGRNQQIGEIIESVSDVADQTQLLAVNAAIEAAKAGDVGRGFGVVAAEMKALAEQSKKSAQRIRGIVGEVQRATADTVRLVETGQARLQEVLSPVSAILPKIDKLTLQVDESGQSGRQIVAIVAQQGAGVEQISQAMKSIQAGVQEGLAQTQQVERAAESLNGLAAKLRDTVAAYRV
ncbi:MAG TPA: hypothetical protein DD490_13595 [Acidobacteria bacterium]|nr:hypothetical protein [Acidobacteriota bacterium]